MSESHARAEAPKGKAEAVGTHAAGTPDERIARLQKELATVRAQLATLAERRGNLESSLSELLAERSAGEKMAKAMAGMSEAERKSLGV